MRRARLHVVPSDNGWQVTSEGAQGPIAHGRTQEEAITVATQLARSQRPSQVLIHRENGRIREEHTYDKDPERYPG